MKLRHSALALALIALPTSLAHAGTVFVDVSAAGAGTGASWSDAYTDLQLALGAAQSGDEIWVAAGTYTPSPTDASMSFVMKDGVALYGGFAGGEINRDQRDWDANVTSLSGDIGQDDIVGSGIYWYVGWNRNTANSGHVIRATGVGATTVVDGFLVEAGATGPTGTPAGHELMSGSGIYCVSSDLTLRNLTFLHNESAWASGGAAYIYNSNPVIENCRFLENYAYLADGGGMFVGGASRPVIRDCEFARNIASAGITDASGGGLHIWSNFQVEVSGCLFEDNQARQPYAVSAHSTFGGGLSAFTNGVIVRDCTFRRNRAQYGGAMMTWGDSKAINSLFVDNEVYVIPNDPFPEIGGWGGAIMAKSYSPIELHLINCTVAYNSGKKYAGLYSSLKATLRIENSILWGNQATHPEIKGGWKEHVAGDFSLAWSCVETIFAPHAPGEDPLSPSKLPGCIDLDPQFVSAGATGDQHLSASSPCLDAGRNDMVDPFTLIDLGGGGRGQDDAAPDTGFGTAPLVDMGAHERGAQALVIDFASVSAALGGTQSMQLDLGASHAGDLYIVVGSLSGTAPGLSLGSAILPLNSDAYTTQTLLMANTGPFVGTLGVLDANGQASAALVLPAPALVGLVGVRADHAAVVLNASGVTATTGSAPLSIEP